MTTKEQVIKMVKAMPDDATVDDVLEELYFKLQVDQCLTELDRGEGIPHEEVERRLAGWPSPSDGFQKLLGTLRPGVTE